MVLHDGYEQTSRDIDSVCPGTYQKVLDFFHLCKRIYDATNDFTMAERTAHPNGCAVLSVFKENLAALQKKKVPSADARQTRRRINFEESCRQCAAGRPSVRKTEETMGMRKTAVHRKCQKER